MRHLYQDETDTFAADSPEHAKELQVELSGEESESEFELMDDDTDLHVAMDGGIPDWVADEPKAWVENKEFMRPTVCAPARIWALHVEAGMVCSTEY